MDELNQNRSADFRQIVSWALYDFASSSYFVVIYTFVFATYFTERIAPNVIQGTALWGYTISASALLIAIVSPFLGAIADFSGHHKAWLCFFTYLAAAAIACLWFSYPEASSIPLVLTCIFVSNFALEVATVFYNSFLPRLAPKGYLGRISGWAWACGYLGGIICLIISLTVFVQGNLGHRLAQNAAANIRAVPMFVAVWLSLFSLPLLLFVKDVKKKKLRFTKAIKTGFHELVMTLRSLPQQKDLSIFLIARMIYIDGLNTLLALGGVYAAGTFKLSISDIMIFGVIINLTAGLGAALFALIDDWIGSKITILISLICLIVTYCYLLIITSTFLFWVTAPIIGIFVGPIQASSRALLSRLTREEEITRSFGFYTLSGKATSFLAPLLVGVVTTITASQRIGMTILIPFFVLGCALLLFVKE